MLGQPTLWLGETFGGNFFITPKLKDKQTDAHLGCWGDGGPRPRFLALSSNPRVLQACGDNDNKGFGF